LPKKEKTKDKGYIFRHLEKKVLNLETEKQLLDTERLRLEQELKRLRNEFERDRSKLEQDHKISIKKNNELISHLNDRLWLADHSNRTLNNTMNQLNTENQLLNAKCLRQERSLNYLRDMISKLRESPLDAASIEGDMKYNPASNEWHCPDCWKATELEYKRTKALADSGKPTGDFAFDYYSTFAD